MKGERTRTAILGLFDRYVYYEQSLSCVHFLPSVDMSIFWCSTKIEFCRQLLLVESVPFWCDVNNPGQSTSVMDWV